MTLAATADHVRDDNTRKTLRIAQCEIGAWAATHFFFKGVSDGGGDFP